MVGSTAKQTCRVEEEQAVKAVENRGDGTWTSGGSVCSEAAAEMSQREWTLRQRTTEGRSLEILGEASGLGPQGASGGRDGHVGKGDVKYKRVLVIYSKEQMPTR